MRVRQMLPHTGNTLDLPSSLVNALEKHPQQHCARFQQLHKLYHAHLRALTSANERLTGVDAVNRQQAAALASFHELDVEIYSQHKDRHQAGVVGTKADGATADGAGAVGEARGGLPSMVRGGSTRLLDHEVPTRPSKGKWHTMVYSARGVLTKNKDDAGKGGSVRARKLEALVKEAISVGVRSHEVAVACEEVKSYRRMLKRACALEAARTRLLTHAATLAEPKLPAKKAIDATDRRRLLGEGEYPPVVHETIAKELQSVRDAANMQLSARTLMHGEGYHQAMLTMRAASGALWACEGGGPRHPPSESKKRPPIPAGFKPADAERGNDLELPGRRRMRATLTALVASASAFALAAERAAVEASIKEHRAESSVHGGRASSIGEEAGVATAPAAVQPPASPRLPGVHRGILTSAKLMKASDSMVPPKIGTYKTSDEACAKLKLFPPSKSDTGMVDVEAAAIIKGYEAFNAAVQAHADSRCNLAAKEACAKDINIKMKPHALRRPQKPPSEAGEHEAHLP